jgi:hypothetical protein|tara:strand:+ start:412 stop:741 length:330 start_codon:yes stop_codon:yes gene_type:complete
MDIIQSIAAVRKEQDGGHAQVSVDQDDINKITWHDGNPTNITNEQILAKQTELKAAYNALAYARTRESAYPSIKDFMEAYTEKEIGADSTKWDEYVIKYNKVRTDNPKG